MSVAVRFWLKLENHQYILKCEAHLLGRDIGIVGIKIDIVRGLKKES